MLVAVAVIVVIVANATSRDPLTDLAVYREAGSAVLHGDRVYMPSGDHLVFTYPPPAALVFVIAASVPVTVAQLTWSLATVATLVAIVKIAYAPLLERVRTRWQVAALGALVGLALVLEPVRQTIFLGQVNVLLVGLVLADTCAQRPWWPRGSLVGVATAIKLTPGFFGVFLWITDRRRAALTSLAAFAACNLVAFIVEPAATSDFWRSDILDTGRLGDMAVSTNQSLHGLVSRVLPDAARLPVWLALAAGFGVLGMVRARRAHKNGNEIAAVALVGLLSVLLSPIAWTHHLVWIVVALGALVGTGRDRNRVLLAVLLGVLFVVPFHKVGDRIADVATGPFWEVLAAPFQNAFCLLAIALVAFLPIDPTDRVGDAPPEAERGGRAAASLGSQ